MKNYNINNILDYLSILLFSIFIISGGKYMILLYFSLGLFTYYFLRGGKEGLIKLFYVILLIGLAIVLTIYLEKELKITFVLIGAIIIVMIFYKRYKDGKNIW